MTHIVAIGGSDAGISAALRARELDPGCEFTVVVADAYPNFSICGIPYYVSGEVAHWRDLAHRTTVDLAATGMRLRLDTLARRIDAAAHTLTVTGPDGSEDNISYDVLVIGTGARPIRPPIGGLTGSDALGAGDGVHLLHSMGDTFALMRTLEQQSLERAVIVGAGYIGLEMAEGLTAHGLKVTQLEQLPEVLPTVDPELGALVHAELERHGVEVRCGTRVQAITRADPDSAGRLRVEARSLEGEPVSYPADVVLVVVGVRPDSELAAEAGAQLGVKDAILVDRQMRTNLPDVFAAGDCVVTHHRLLGQTYLPLGRAASPARTPSAQAESSPAASAPRSSRSSTSSPPAPAYATTKPRRPAMTRSASPATPTITRPTTPAATRSPCATRATATRAASSACSSLATYEVKSPSASTCQPRRSTTR